MSRTIAIVANEAYGSLRGGGGRFLSEITPRLAKNYQVKLIVPGPTRKVRCYSPLPNLEVSEFPGLFWRRPHKYFTLFGPRALRPIWQSELLFAQSSNCVLPLYLALWTRRPIVLYLHELVWAVWPRFLGLNGLSAPTERVLRGLLRYCFNCCRLVLLPTASFRESVLSLNAHPPMSVVPLGIDHQHFTPPEDRNAEKAKWGFSPEDLILGYVGRLSREKNVGLLVKSLKTLQGKFPQLKLLIVGGGIPAIEQKLRQFSNVRLLGWQDEVAPCYRAMDLFCMPSPFETTSLATMEAMASGVPPVAVRGGRIGEYIQDGKSGFVVQPGNEAQLIRSLEKLLANAALRKKMGQRAREAMCRDFTWDDTAEQIRQELDKVLARDG